MCRKFFYTVSLVFLFFFLLSGSALAVEGVSDLDDPWLIYGFETEDDFVDFAVFLHAYSFTDPDCSFEEYLHSQYPDFDVDVADSIYQNILENSTVTPLADSAVVLSFTVWTGGTVGNGMTGALSFSFTQNGVSKIVTLRGIPVTAGQGGSSFIPTQGAVSFLDYAKAADVSSSWTLADVIKILSLTGSIDDAIRNAGDDSTVSLAGWLKQIQASNQAILNQFSSGGSMLGPSGQVFYYIGNGGSVGSFSSENVTIPYMLTFMAYSMANSALTTFDKLSTLSNNIISFNSSVNRNHNDLFSRIIDYGVSSVDFSFLSDDGLILSNSSLENVQVDLANLLAMMNTSLVGQNVNTLYALTGGRQNSVHAPFYVFDSDTLERQTQTLTYDNLLDAIVHIGSSIQRPLSQLQHVLASDADLKLRQETDEFVDAITDDFTGDGPAAPTVDDIKDIAGISGDFSGMFDSGVGPGELIGVVNGGDTYSFFSQEVADSLDTVANAGISLFDLDDLFDLSGYEETEDGFLVPVDNPLLRGG